MRRKERELKGFDQILEVISNGEVLHLGMVDEGKPYVVPLNFGWSDQGEQVSLYFHSAKAGRKIDVLRKNAQVCFSLVGEAKLSTGPDACDWTTHYASVLGEGTVEFLEEPEDKAQAMDYIMAHNGFEGPPAYAPAMLNATALIRINVTSLSGKANRPKG